MPNRHPSADDPLEGSAAGIETRASKSPIETQEAMSDVARTASDTVKDGPKMAANSLDRAASTVHEQAEQLPGGPKVKEFAHAAADRLSTTADYMRSHDATRMMADVEALVKDNPGPALAVAAAIGFLFGRALSRD